MVCRGRTAFGQAGGAPGGQGRPQRLPLLGLPPPHQPLPPATLAWCPAPLLKPEQRRGSRRRRGRDWRAHTLHGVPGRTQGAGFQACSHGHGRGGASTITLAPGTDPPPHTHPSPPGSPVQGAWPSLLRTGGCGSSQMQSPSSARCLPRTGCYGPNCGSQPSPTDSSSHSQLTNENPHRGERSAPDALRCLVCWSQTLCPRHPPTHSPHCRQAGAPYH